EGDLFRWDGFRAAADAPSAAAQRLAQHNRLAELDGLITAAEAKAQAARSAYHIARGAASAAQEAAVASRKRLRAAQAPVNCERENAQSVERALAQSSARLAALEANERRVREDLMDAHGRAATSRTELEALGDDAGRRAKIASAKEDLAALRV